MFTSQPLEEYALALSEIVPVEDPRFYFLSSGSEVVEGGLKLARQIQMARGEDDRKLIISRNQSYHGMTLGALSVSGRPPLRAPYIDMMADMPHIDPPYPYRYPADGQEAAGWLEEAINHYGPENIAAFIAEPVSGAGLGAVVPPNDYWPIVRAICDRYEILLIADEVLVGHGRTGRWWGIDHWDVQPDILVAAKGAAGGYFPLGFIAARGEDIGLIKEKYGDFNHGGTFSHHAVGAAAGLATLKIINEENLVKNSARMGTLLGAMLAAHFGDHPHIGDIRGRGLFWALEIVEEKSSKQPYPAEKHVAWRLWKEAFNLGLITYASQGCADGRNGDLLILGPPLIIQEEELEQILSKLRQAISIFFGPQ
jgi:adenosylmethionine-8-amino-7-oxononanoate aminotransferase